MQRRYVKITETTYMKTNEQNSYQSPVTEVYEIEVEQILCGSILEDLGGEKDPIDW